MNIRRGLFRIWLVLSVLFAIAVGVLTYDSVKRGFDEAAVMEMVRGDQIIMPVMCGFARGVAGTDYTTKENQKPGPWDTYAKPNPFDTCYYMSVPDYRRQFPEFAAMSEKDLVKKAYADAGTPTRDIGNPWLGLLAVVGWAVGIPLLILAIGSALFWAFAGFKRTPAEKS
jgi:hypothetical protein